jgi:integral membrane protein (TIGR01906 family)
MKASLWHRVSGWLVVLLTPVVIVLGAVRLLLTPVFIQIEYRLPNFPEDSYGFTMAERLYWSEIARQYLLNDEDISFLGDLAFEDGSSLYNPRELRHMVDVKNVVATALWVLYLSLGVVALLGLWAHRGGWWWGYRQALSRGGWLTVSLVGAVILLIALNFNAFFVGFHRVFFEGDTWLFRFSDTLIRLFPVRFWQDTFILVAGLALMAGGALGYFVARPRRS